MKIRYLADLAGLTGRHEEEISGPGTVIDLLQELSARYGTDFERQILNAAGDDAGDDVFVLVNGRHIRHLQGVRTLLQDTDEISLIPVIEAG